MVIPTKNRAKQLPTILDSLLSSSYKNFEVIIIDGGSTDNTREIVNKYTDKLSIQFDIQLGGLIKQENKALELAKGEIFLRTDDDAEFPPNVLKEIIKTFDLADDIGGVTGPTITTDMQSRDLFLFQNILKKGNLFWRLIGKIYYSYILEGGYSKIGRFFKSGAVSLGANLPHALKLSSPIEVDMHECTSMAIRMDILKQIEGFDNLYGGVGDYNEVDVSFKIRERGYKIILNPRAAVLHHVSKNGIFSARTDSFLRIQNFIYFYYKHIRPNTLDKIFRFITYTVFQCGYYCYLYSKIRKIELLGCISGVLNSLYNTSFNRELRNYLFNN